MTCERCKGLMVSEQMCDLRGTNRDLCANGYRCLLCGDVVDATILENRKRPAGASAPSSPIPLEYQASRRSLRCIVMAIRLFARLIEA